MVTWQKSCVTIITRTIILIDCPVRLFLDPCNLQAEYGDCRDSHVRWFFNADTRMCEDFEYSGCRGNQNRFMDKQACEERCNANVIDVIVPITKYGKSSWFLICLLDFVEPF